MSKIGIGNEEVKIPKKRNENKAVFVQNADTNPPKQRRGGGRTSDERNERV
jgi:hypothetical protein